MTKIDNFLIPSPQKVSLVPHFLFLRQSFDIQRRDLLAGVLERSHPSKEILTQLLMYGSKDIPDEINRNILELTLRFIHKTGRFD